MAKLYFRYGTMNSSKTTSALMTSFNFRENGMKVLLLSPKVANRDGDGIVASRVGLKEKAYSLDIIETSFDIKEFSAIIVDEVQFATINQINILANIVDELKIPVLCYGLHTDSNGYLFEASKRLFEIADICERLKTVCWCGKGAIMNGRIENGEIVKEAPQINTKGEYVALCRHHWNLGLWKKDM